MTHFTAHLESHLDRGRRSADERDDAGFSLIEQIVVVGVLGIVLIIVFGFLMNATATTTRADANVRAEQEAIAALRTATEDLRSARSLSACAGLTFDKCVTIEISQVTSGTGTCPKRVLKYQVVGTDFRQTLTDYAANCTTVTKSGTRTLIGGVQSTSIFTYYGTDGITALNLAVAADANKVTTTDTKAVKVSLSVKYRNSVNPLNLSSFASLRNNR